MYTEYSWRLGLVISGSSYTFVGWCVWGYAFPFLFEHDFPFPSTGAQASNDGSICAPSEDRAPARFVSLLQIVSSKDAFLSRTFQVTFRLLKSQLFFRRCSRSVFPRLGDDLPFFPWSSLCCGS